MDALKRQAAARALEHVRDGTVSLVSSPALLTELAEVMERSKFDAIFTKTNTSRERSLAG